MAAHASADTGTRSSAPTTDRSTAPTAARTAAPTAARSADPAAARAEFEALLVPLLPRAYAAANYMTGDAADADDLVQEAALRAWRGFDGFQSGTNFRAWFLRILTNAWRSTLRSRRREGPAVSLDDAPELYLYERTRAAGLHDRDENPARSLISRLDAGRVEAAIAKLPDEYRSVAALYVVDELSYQEIADALDIPVGTVRSRLHRARRRLQVELWELAVEQGLVRADDAA